MKKVRSRIAIYIAIVILPVIISVIAMPNMDFPFLYLLGKNLALVGFMILAMQLVIASRIHWISNAFGFDVLLRYHKNVAIFGTIMIILHPILLAAGSGDWSILFSFDLSWNVLLGKAAFLLVLLQVVVSAFQPKLKMKFEVWRAFHDVLAPLIVILVFVHSLFTGTGIQTVPALMILWFITLLFAMTVYLAHILFRPAFAYKNAYTVSEVITEAEGVWTIKMTPPDGKKIFDYQPGQFLFVKHLRPRTKGEKKLPAEEHHFTIVSSPTDTEAVYTTIKNLGDYTSTIGETRPGDKAMIQAPFGHFSYLNFPDEKGLVFIAGGIGITPVMSMLRHMRDTQSEKRAVLFYANQTEDSIVFREELDAMQASDFPRVEVVHVITKPSGDWTGESGYIDRARLEKYVPAPYDDKGYYLVGPEPLIQAAIKNLLAMGVPEERIHIELFRFLD